MKKIGLLLLILTFIKVGQAQTAAETIFDDVDLKVESMFSINTIGSDISPALVEGQLYFSGVRQQYFNKKGRERRNTAFYDTYFAPLQPNGNTSSVRMLVPGFGAKYHEGPVSFCTATGELFTTLSNIINPDTIQKVISVEDIKLRLVIEKKINERWEITEELPFNDKRYNLAHPAISITGDTLVFTSDKDSVSIGKSDLFMSIRKNGRWSKPENLGNTINTKGNEMFPAFLPGGLLAFASDGHPGNIGRLDIWYTTFPKPGAIINAGDLINTPFDDFGLVVSADGKTGYFSSDRPGKGSDDIYRLDIKKLYKIFKGRVVDDQTSIPIANSDVKSLDCEGKVLAEVQSDVKGKFSLKVANDNCAVIEASKEGYITERTEVFAMDSIEIRLKKRPIVINLTVNILDAETGLIIPDAVFTVEKGDYDHSKLELDSGIVRIKLYESTKYTFTAKGNEYFPTTVEYSSEDKPAGDYTLNILLEKMTPGKQFVLDDLYYDLDKYNIRPDAAIVLDRLVKILLENPEIRIEIDSHTDCRATDKYNMTLSQHRSESVVAYLISHGVNKSRLVAKGFGETQLVNKCADGVPCTEEEHQANRRTVIEILNKDIRKVKRGARDAYYF
jgi:outer membrane protein OmpA-like peptidoglycan-associated protein